MELIVFLQFLNILVKMSLSETFSTADRIWKEAWEGTQSMFSGEVSFDISKRIWGQMDCCSDIALRLGRRNQLGFCLFIIFLYSLPFYIALSSCSGCGKGFIISKGLSVLYQLAIKGYRSRGRTFDGGNRALPADYVR